MKYVFDKEEILLQLKIRRSPLNMRLERATLPKGIKTAGVGEKWDFHCERGGDQGHVPKTNKNYNWIK